MPRLGPGRGTCDRPPSILLADKKTGSPGRQSSQVRRLEDTTIASVEFHFADRDSPADLPIQGLDIPNPISGWFPVDFGLPIVAPLNRPYGGTSGSRGIGGGFTDARCDGAMKLVAVPPMVLENLPGFPSSRDLQYPLDLRAAVFCFARQHLQVVQDLCFTASVRMAA